MENQTLTSWKKYSAGFIYPLITQNECENSTDEKLELEEYRFIRDFENKDRYQKLVTYREDLLKKKQEVVTDQTKVTEKPKISAEEKINIQTQKFIKLQFYSKTMMYHVCCFYHLKLGNLNFQCKSCRL